MSGGSWDYKYRHVQELGEALSEQPFGDESRYMEGLGENAVEILLDNDIDPQAEMARRTSFGEILQGAAELARAIEWFDSGDTGSDALYEAYRKFQREHGGLLMVPLPDEE